jgi:hypothetical protein
MTWKFSDDRVQQRGFDGLYRRSGKYRAAIVGEYLIGVSVEYGIHIFSSSAFRATGNITHKFVINI